MRKYKLAKTTVLLSLLGSLAQANSDGFYIGADVGIISFGANSMEVEKNDKSKTTYNDILGSFGTIKAGCQHFNNNRVELYFRAKTLDTKEGDIETQSFGLNYEWAFSSFASDKIMPYISLGFGFGEATSDKLKPIDKVDIGEINFGIGMHYKFTENIDAQVAYSRIGTIFDNFYDEETDEISAVCQNNIMLGISYKF